MWEYELEFSLLCRFSGCGMDEEDLIMRFLDGMQVELCGRCSVVSYASLEDLVEKVVVKDTCMAEEHKFLKATQPKTGGTSGSEKRTWYQPNVKYNTCVRMQHKSRSCWSRPLGAQVAAPAAAEAPV